MSEPPRFPDTFRIAAKSRGFSIREISKRLDWSYEHVRKVFGGEPVLSEQKNDELCDLLGIDSKAMWRLIAQAKIRRKFGAAMASEIWRTDAAGIAPMKAVPTSSRVAAQRYFHAILVGAPSAAEARAEAERTLPAKRERSNRSPHTKAATDLTLTSSQGVGRTRVEVGTTDIGTVRQAVELFVGLESYETKSP